MKHIQITFMDNKYFYAEVPDEVLNHSCPDDERMKWVMANFNNVKRIEWCEEPKYAPLVARQADGSLIRFYMEEYPVENGPDDVQALIRAQSYKERVDRVLPGRINNMLFWFAA